MSSSPSTRATSQYTELSAMIQREGLLRRRYGYYARRLIAIPIVMGVMITAFILIGDTWWQLVTAVAFGVVFTQIAFLGHDAAHRQIFVSGRKNDWVTRVIGDLFVGMSSGWWRHKHTRHHANPNKIDADPDIDLPVISFTPEQVQRRHHPFARWLTAHQGVWFFPILPLEGISLHLSSVQRVFAREPMDRRWVEILFLTIRLGGFAALVFWVLSPGVGAAFLAVQLGVFGFYMGASFAPNHKGMPLVPANTKLDFLFRQAAMSRNIRGSRALDTLMGGLNYQIEHHLFPSMPRPHLRRASAVISAYCREHGVPYMETGLLQSYAIVIRYINRVGIGERDPFDCPLLAERREGTSLRLAPRAGRDAPTPGSEDA